MNDNLIDPIIPPGYIPSGDAQVEVNNATHAQKFRDRIIWTEGTSIIDMLDPTSQGLENIRVRCISGTCAFNPAAGTTVESATLTLGQSVTLGPRASTKEWTIL